MSSTDALRNKVRSNDELIARLHERIALLEHRLRVVLTEVKRERENPLPEAVAAPKPKLRLADAVLQVAPKNEGRETNVLERPAPRFRDEDRAAVPSSSGFFPEPGVLKPYAFEGKVQFEEDVLVLRAYLKAGLIQQVDYEAQRDIMLHALHGGANFGYQGSNFTHTNDWLEVDSKTTKKLLKVKK